MDLSADSGTLPTHGNVGEPGSGLGCQTEDGGSILLQLLEFKTHLLEAVEELHIRRDAETRFADQISKLALEKQELEWEKESLQHQTETMVNQHTESLISVKKQFQAKIRCIEEEKGKYQVSAELKEKEINNLKEELKLLQLLKYNLEKKTAELEQKLALQIRSKDRHLNQLGEVEKRFSVLSRQCAMVKQAHERLEQNVDEAMKRNKVLKEANEKQEATIVLLKKELEEVSNKWIKAKMASVIHDKSLSPSGKEQPVKQLHQKLNLETEMNNKLNEENEAVRKEKQDVVRSLQQTQQLLLSQTQTVSRVELDLQRQREQYQALKLEHEVMREKTKAAEDKAAQLMESYSASKSNWDKEKMMLLNRMKSEQHELEAMNKAYDELHQKHTELSSQAKDQAQLIYDSERKDSSQSLIVSTQLFPTLMDTIRGDETLNKPISSSETPGVGSLQPLASTQAKRPDCLDDTRAVTEPATGATGGQVSPNNQLSQFKQPQTPANLVSYTNNNLCSLSGTACCDSSKLNKCCDNSRITESQPNEPSVSDDGPLMIKGSCVSELSTASSPRLGSVCGSSDLVSTEMNDGGKSDKQQGQKEKEKEKGETNIREEMERNEEEQWNREEFQGDDVKEGGSGAEMRGTLMAQTTDRADRQEDSQRSAEDTKQPETETQDTAEAGGPDGEEDRVEPGPHSTETQIQAQTTTDMCTKKSDTQQVINLMSSEPPPALCSQSLSQKVKEKVADSSHVKEGQESCDEHKNVSQRPNSLIQEVQDFGYVANRSRAQHLLHQASEETTGETPSDKSLANILTKLTEAGTQSSTSSCSPQTVTAVLPAQSDHNVSIQVFETTKTQPGNPSDITSNRGQTDEMGDISVFGYTQVETQHLDQEIPEQLSVLVTAEEDSCIYDKRGRPACVDDACETAQKHVEKPNLKDASDGNRVDTGEYESEIGICSHQECLNTVEHAGDAKTHEGDADLKPSSHSRHGHDTSPNTISTNCYEPPAKQMLHNDANASSHLSNKTYRSSFDWYSIQRTAASTRTQSHGSVLHHFGQGSTVSSNQNTSSPVGLKHPSSTTPMFLKSKHNKVLVPLVITRASDLLDASSVSGTAASLRRDQQGEWNAMGEMCRETVTPDMENRGSVSISSVPTSTSVSWETTPGSSRASSSTAGVSSGSDWEWPCSQEREDQQSFRAQISKIEHFLSKERLSLAKRRRTDN